MNRTLISIARAEGETLEDYIERAGQQALEDNIAICRTIDRSIGSGYRSQSTVDNPKVIAKTINAQYNARKRTMADLASDNPLIAALLRAGF